MGIVKISDQMHENLRLAGTALSRSINAQAEHWMRVGMLAEMHPELDHREICQLLVRAELAGGLVGAFFAFGGWWDLSKLGAEVKNPGRNLAHAMVWGVLVVTALYVLTSAAFMYLVPPGSVEDGEAFVAQVGELLFGAAGGTIFSLVVIVSVLGAMAGLMLAAPRVYFAMAQDDLFLHSVGKLLRPAIAHDPDRMLVMPLAANRGEGIGEEALDARIVRTVLRMPQRRDECEHRAKLTHADVREPCQAHAVDIGNGGRRWPLSVRTWR